jgi:hypothetical protein
MASSLLRVGLLLACILVPLPAKDLLTSDVSEDHSSQVSPRMLDDDSTKDKDDTKDNGKDAKDKDEDNKDKDEDTKDKDKAAKDKDEDTRDKDEDAKDKDKDAKDKGDDTKDKDEDAKDNDKDAKGKGDDTKDKDSTTKKDDDTTTRKDDDTTAKKDDDTTTKKDDDTTTKKDDDTTTKKDDDATTTKKETTTKKDEATKVTTAATTTAKATAAPIIANIAVESCMSITTVNASDLCAVPAKEALTTGFAKSLGVTADRAKMTTCIGQDVCFRIMSSPKLSPVIQAADVDAAGTPESDLQSALDAAKLPITLAAVASKPATTVCQNAKADDLFCEHLPPCTTTTPAPATCATFVCPVGMLKKAYPATIQCLDPRGCKQTICCEGTPTPESPCTTATTTPGAPVSPCTTAVAMIYRQYEKSVAEPKQVSFAVPTAMGLISLMLIGGAAFYVHARNRSVRQTVRQTPRFSSLESERPVARDLEQPIAME